MKFFAKHRGSFGKWSSALLALEMVFFTVSGIWMYVQMWRNRSARSLKPGWFWK